jgi:DNA topoisomerase-1
MLVFARRLPRIRRAVQRDLRRQGIGRERVLALVVSLLDRTLLRVGNEAYVRANRSYGLTTLRDRHAQVSRDRVRFRFTGKGGQTQDVTVRDRRVARLVGRIQDLPGQHLFDYLADDGTPVPVASDDVNDYLRSISGADVTAKDFRTWTATVLAFRALRREPPAANDAAARRTVKAAMEAVAARLGNTATVCRASYVDPGVVEAWVAGEMEPRSGGHTDEVLDGPPTRAEELEVLRVLSPSCQPRASRGGRRAARPPRRGSHARAPRHTRRDPHGNDEGKSD